jgi:hypothetical protein
MTLPPLVLRGLGEGGATRELPEVRPRPNLIPCLYFLIERMNCPAITVVTARRTRAVAVETTGERRTDHRFSRSAR